MQIFKKNYTKALFIWCFEICEVINITLRKLWAEKINILIEIRLIVKGWKKVTVKWLKTAWRERCPSYSNEETSD